MEKYKRSRIYVAVSTFLCIVSTVLLASINLTKFVNDMTSAAHAAGGEGTFMLAGVAAFIEMIIVLLIFLLSVSVQIMGVVAIIKTSEPIHSKKKIVKIPYFICHILLAFMLIYARIRFILLFAKLSK